MAYDPTVVLTRSTLAAMKALISYPQEVQTQGRATSGDGGGGTFTFRTGDQSANVTADPEEGIWVAPDNAPTGASGAWQRVYSNPVMVQWFGNDFTALKAAWAYTKAQGEINLRCERGVEYEVTEGLNNYSLVNGFNVGVPVWLDGNGCTFTCMSSYRGVVFWLLGGWETQQTVSAVAGDNKYVTVTDSSVFTPASVARIGSDRALQGGMSASTKQGEFISVESVNTGTDQVFFRAPLFQPYDVSEGVYIAALRDVPVEIFDFDIQTEPSATAYANWLGLIQFDALLYPKSRDIRCPISTATVFGAYSCYGWHAKDFVFEYLAADLTDAEIDDGESYNLLYDGNGVQTVFEVSFVFGPATDLYVYVDNVLQTLTTNYTVTGGLGATGEVTFLVAPPVGLANVRIRRPVNRANGVGMNRCEMALHENHIIRNGQHALLNLVGSGSLAGSLSGYGWSAHNRFTNIDMYGSDWAAMDTHHGTYNHSFENCNTVNCGAPGQFRGSDHKIIGHTSVNDLTGFGTHIQSSYLYYAVSTLTDNGAGLIRVTVVGSPSSTRFQDGQNVTLLGTTAAAKADGNWWITKISDGVFDLRDSTYVAAGTTEGHVFRAMTSNIQWYDCVIDRSGYGYYFNRRTPGSTVIGGQIIVNRTGPNAPVDGDGAPYLIKGVNIDVIPDSPVPLAIQSITNNGAGLIRVTTNEGDSSQLSDGQYVKILGTNALTTADGNWVITKISSTVFDLDGSTYAAAGGVLGSVYGVASRAILNGSIDSTIEDVSIDISRTSWANSPVIDTGISASKWNVQNLKIRCMTGTDAPNNIWRGNSSGWIIFDTGSNIGNITIDALTENIVRSRTQAEIRPFMTGPIFVKEDKLLWSPIGLAADIIAVSATTYTLSDEINGNTLRFTSATAVTITVPSTLSEGFTCRCIQAGAGALTFSGTATINNFDGLTTSTGLYSTAELTVGDNTGGSAAIATLVFSPEAATGSLETRRYLGALRRTGATVPPWFATAINTFYTSLGSAGLLDTTKVSGLWCHRNITESCVRINMITPGSNTLVQMAAAANLPTFTQYVGSTGVANSGYSTALAVSATPGQSINNTGTFAMINGGTPNVNAIVAIYSGSSSQRTLQLGSRNAAFKVTGRAGASSVSTSTATVADSDGFRAVLRRDASNQRLYEKLGAFMETFAIASTAVSGTAASLFGSGTGGAVTSATDTVTYWGVIGGLTDTEVTALYTALAALNTAIDARP